MQDSLKLFLVVCTMWVFGISAMYVSNLYRPNGDMNKDGELTLVDLSILAERICNEQR